MSEEGAVFQSYLDGQTILLSPELSIETQKAIGSDIMMALDQCIASTADEADRAGGARYHASLGGAQSGRARRFAAIDVCDRAGRALPGAATRKCGAF